MEWSNDLVREFLNLYESEPVIWNPQNEFHKDRNEVHDAWRRIQNSLSFQCSLKELKKRKETLIATYRKLVTKVNKSILAGGEIYKPEWFAYDRMASFLHSAYTPRTLNSEEFPTIDIKPESQASDSSSLSFDPLATENSSNKRKREDREENEVLDRRMVILENPQDDAVIFGNFVASAIRNLRTDELRRRLKRKIQRIILDIEEEDEQSITQ